MVFDLVSFQLSRTSFSFAIRQSWALLVALLLIDRKNKTCSENNIAVKFALIFGWGIMLSNLEVYLRFAW